MSWWMDWRWWMRPRPLERVVVCVCGGDAEASVDGSTADIMRRSMAEIMSQTRGGQFGKRVGAAGEAQQEQPTDARPMMSVSRSINYSRRYVTLVVNATLVAN